MAKIAYSNDPVKSFGGFHFVYGLLKSNDIVKQIDTVLGTRNSNVKYKLSDVLLGCKTHDKSTEYMCEYSPLADIEGVIKLTC